MAKARVLQRRKKISASERRRRDRERRITLKSLQQQVESLRNQIIWHRQQTEKLDTHLYRLFEAQAELRDAYKQVFGIQVGEELLRMKIDPRLTSIGGYNG